MDRTHVFEEGVKKYDELAAVPRHNVASYAQRLKL